MTTTRTSLRRSRRGLRELDGMSEAWCKLVIDNIPNITATIDALLAVFPPVESRHAKNMATLLGASWAVLHDEEITETEAEDLIQAHRAAIDELEGAHQENDSADCVAALLQFRPTDTMLGTHLFRVFAKGTKDGDQFRERLSIGELATHGIRVEDDGFLVANQHRGTSEAYRGTLWEGSGWATALARLPGAKKVNPRRFSLDTRSRSIWLPRDLVSDEYEEPEG